MRLSGLRLNALFCAALALASAAEAADAARAATTEPAAATAAAKPEPRTAAKPQAKASAPKPRNGAATSPATKTTAKAAATKVSRRTTATRKRSATEASGDLAGADGIVETECYRLSRGKGRCEPQCLPYTRCRSGISSCRSGHENGPVTWFHCEQARGNTSLSPADGRVLVLGRNAHNMSTGHTLYVEKAAARADGRYDLVLSHTNYDRRCNLETNMRAEYDPIAKTIDVRSGKWEPWGRDLRVSGFIHN